MRWLLVLVVGVVVGCGQVSHAAVPPSSKAESGVAARLAGMAYAQARAAGNPHPRSVAYVASHRKVAVQVSEGGDIVDSNQPVFVVEVVGPFPHYERFSVPAAVNPAMPCRALTFTVERATWGILDSGCGASFDLGKLGHPHPLVNSQAVQKRASGSSAATPASAMCMDITGLSCPGVTILKGDVKSADPAHPIPANVWIRMAQLSGAHGPACTLKGCGISANALRIGHGLTPGRWLFAPPSLPGSTTPTGISVTLRRGHTTSLSIIYQPQP